ncbi:putative cue domain containing protein [Rhypophila decipiens]
MSGSRPVTFTPKDVEKQIQYDDETKLPAFTRFPAKEWVAGLSEKEWVGCLDTWNTVIEKHLEETETEFQRITVKDESLSKFLTTFADEVAEGGHSILGKHRTAKYLLESSLDLACRLLASPSPPRELTQWEFIANMCKVYNNNKARRDVLLSCLSESSRSRLFASLASLKKFFIQHLNTVERHEAASGPDDVDRRLYRVSYLIDASPEIASFFMEGSDFLDGLIECFSDIHVSHRTYVIPPVYKCLVGLAKAQKWTALTDHLYTLKAAGDKYKANPLMRKGMDRTEDIVGSLVASTYLLGTLWHEIASAGHKSTRITSVLKDLATFREKGCKYLGKKTSDSVTPLFKVDKGKRPDKSHQPKPQHENQMSQIGMVQELFPDLGSGFIAKFLDEYNNNVEQVIALLLEDTTPLGLENLDRSEELADLPSSSKHRFDLAPRTTPPPPSDLPIRRNAFDGDEFDRLTESNSLATANPERLRIGKRQDVDADKLLADRSKAPTKEKILAALEAFDSDDDERDDTYDVDDVGGTVDVVNPEEDVVTEGTEAKLYQAYMATPKLFGRDNATRGGIDRVRLRHETGMTDEAIEGWAIMLGRDSKKRKRLQARYGDWAGKQTELASTSWKAKSDEEEEDGDQDDSEKPAGSSGDNTRGRGRGRGGAGRGRGGRPGAPPGSELEKRRKEANKASRANHNRRDGHAKKMARGGGFLPQSN